MIADDYDLAPALVPWSIPVTVQIGRTLSERLTFIRNQGGTWTGAQVRHQIASESFRNRRTSKRLKDRTRVGG
jgi:hypothetical protein